jgi:DNA-binding NarL/FixJ family response regulator
MITVILVDDHAMLREGLRSRFRTCSDIEVVGEAGTGEELQALLKQITADVVIMDIKLPDISGIKLMQKVRQAFPECQTVILTMYDNVRYALMALNAGAKGYVVKGSPFEELFEAVQCAASDRTYVSKAIVPKLLQRIRRGETASPGLEMLSDREFEALTLLSSGLPLKQAATRMGVSEKTLSTYRSRFMNKLHLKNTTDLVRFSLETGLLQ